MNSKPSRFGSNLVAGISRYGRNAHPPTLRPFGLNHWVLNLTLEGKGRINSGADRFHAEPGDILLFPPRLRHDYGWAGEGGDWVHLWIYFCPLAHWTPLLRWPGRGGPALGFTLSDAGIRARVRAAMERSLETYGSASRNRLALCANALEEALLWCDEANPWSGGAKADERIRAAVVRMMKDFAGPLRVDRLARDCSLSASRFAHLFQADMGESPARYLDGIRIRKAQELLIGTSRSVKEISLEVGYRDPLYFSRAFRRKVGLSPKAFRKDSKGPDSAP
jgi:AraC family transcriptional regulator of arabinose operon